MKHFLLLLVSFSLLSVPAHALDTSAKQAIIVDYETGAVLFEKNAAARMPTSSMSKVMTMYMVFDALKNRTIKLDDTFKVSEKAWRKGGSKMFVKVNSDVSIEDLVRGVIIQSGNDATIVLAEGLAGSENAFAEKMTEKASSLGMKNSNFKNASGWPDSDHYSTAWDLALLGRRLINDFPDFYPYYAEKEFTYNDIRQQNRNPLLHQGIGGDGIKTGHTEAGGYGLIGSGIQNDRRIVLVINGLESAKDRAQESKKLMLHGLQNFKNETIFEPGNTVGQASILLGEKETVFATVEKPLRLTLPRNADKNIVIKTELQSNLEAPITQGQTIGKLIVSAPGMPETSRPLIAAENVKELGLFSRVMAKAKLLVFGS